jgi:hypothetical protein
LSPIDYDDRKHSRPFSNPSPSPQPHGPGIDDLGTETDPSSIRAAPIAACTMLLVATIVMSRGSPLDVRDPRRWAVDTLQPYPGFVCDHYKE